MTKKNVIALETLFSFLDITDWLTVVLRVKPTDWEMFKDGKQICAECILKRNVFHNGQTEYVLDFQNLYTSHTEHTISHETLEGLIRALRNSLKGMVLVVVTVRGADFPDEFWIEGLA